MVHAGAVATVNGALSGSTTLVVDTVTGTLAVGQVITVQDTGTAAITDADGNSGLSTDNSLTITAVASQTSVTVSEAITVANNVILLAMADGGEEVNAESIDFQVAGPEFAAAGSAVDITGIARTGEELGGRFFLNRVQRVVMMVKMLSYLTVQMVVLPMQTLSLTWKTLHLVLLCIHRQGQAVVVLWFLMELQLLQHKLYK